MVTIAQIHDSLINGQRRQMVDQIDEYGPMDFWPEYAEYVAAVCDTDDGWRAYEDLKDAVGSYFRIKGR
jgi:hypothetical protein